MDQAQLPSSKRARHTHATTLRGRIARAGLVSAICAVLGAGFFVAPHAASHATATHTVSHGMVQSIAPNDTIGGPGTALTPQDTIGGPGTA